MHCCSTEIHVYMYIMILPSCWIFSPILHQYKSNKKIVFKFFINDLIFCKTIKYDIVLSYTVIGNLK